MIHLLVRVYTQTSYQANYLFFAQVRPDGLSVSSIDRATARCGFNLGKDATNLGKEKIVRLIIRLCITTGKLFFKKVCCRLVAFDHHEADIGCVCITCYDLMITSLLKVVNRLGGS